MEPGLVATVDWELWSSRARICVTESGTLDRARIVVDRILSDVEAAASRFRADSEITNLAAGWSTVSPTLALLMSAALRAAETSDGAVDPTLGGALRAIGYDRDIRLVARSSMGNASWSRTPGWKSLKLRGRRLFLPDGVELDLGATAKAVAADWCADAVARRWETGVLVSLGGDIATAGPPPKVGWQVRVQDTAEDPWGQVALAPGAAIATSSTVRRSWRPGVHHIIDPRTGRSAVPVWRSVSAVAATCVEANMISTAAVVKGTGAVPWIRRVGRPARLVSAAGRVVLVNAWPEERAA